MNGSEPQNTSDIRAFAIAWSTKMTVPTGGVSSPIICEMIISTPSAIGSTSYAALIGSRIGTVSVSTAIASSAVPRTIESAKTSSRNTVALSVRPSIELGHLLRDPLAGEDVAEQVGRRDDQHDGAGRQRSPRRGPSGRSRTFRVR